MGRGKVDRILAIYSKLKRGDGIKKRELADRFGVSEKTIQRDIEDIRSYMYEDSRGGHSEIIYSHDRKLYYLEKVKGALSKEAVLAVTKILLESRALCKTELEHLSNGIIGNIEGKKQNHIRQIIGNELTNYAPVNHGELLLSKLWDISEYIRYREVMEIDYRKTDGSEVKREIKPVSIIFSEYYFYLVAYFNDYESPAIFRVDRIKSYCKSGEKYRIPESKRFEDGEFRKRIQFMYPGKLMRIKFEFKGPSLEAVLDRLPTARVVEETEQGYTVEAEVYGKGIKMWLLSQGMNIKVLEPESLVEEMKKEVEELVRLYGGE